MSVVAAVKKNLGVKIALKLAVVMLVLTAAAATVITWHESRQMAEMTLEKAKVAAGIGARQYGDLLENVISSDVLTVNDVFDRAYVPIKGFDFGNTPRYHTRYDAVTDRVVLLLQDKFLDYEDFVFAIGVDENGYIPTHNTKFMQKFTGDTEKDKSVNRSKYLANHTVGINAAKNTEPSLVQVYRRDTGEMMWDVSAPIYVKGKHWGAFRLAVSMERIAARQRSLLATLAGVFAIFFGVTVVTMYLVVRSAMKPVVALTAAAEQMSLGEALDVPIKSTSQDEIGQLTKTVDRLRVSMKAAMSRLGQ
jgi:hypothetical protein